MDALRTAEGITNDETKEVAMTYAPEWKTFAVTIMDNTCWSDDADRSPEGIITSIQEAVKEIGEGGRLSFSYGYDGDVSVDYEVSRMETQEEADARYAEAIRQCEYREAQERQTFERLKARFEVKP